MKKPSRKQLSKIKVSHRGGFSIHSKDVFEDKQNALDFFEEIQKQIKKK